MNLEVDDKTQAELMALANRFRDLKARDKKLSQYEDYDVHPLLKIINDDSRILLEDSHFSDSLFYGHLFKNGAMFSGIVLEGPSKTVLRRGGSSDVLRATIITTDDVCMVVALKRTRGCTIREEGTHILVL